MFKKISKALKESAVGFLCGLGLIILSGFLLWMVEDDYFKSSEFLKRLPDRVTEASDAIKVRLGGSAEASPVPENGDAESDLPDLDGLIIHACGDLSASEYAFDDYLCISGKYIALERKVQYYQWTEKRIREDDDDDNKKKIRYEYSKEWLDGPVRSSSFHREYGHKNTVLFTLPSKKFKADNIRLGCMPFDESVIDKISVLKDIDISEDDGWHLAAAKNLKIAPSHAHVKDCEMYFGTNPNKPEIGDVRISYRAMDSGIYTVIGGVDKGCITSIKDSPSSYFRIEAGNVSVEDMVAHSKQESVTDLWLLRLFGLLIALFGFFTMIEPLIKLVEDIPILCNIADAGGFLATAVFAVSWSLFIISTAWLFYRPFIALLILVAAVCIIYFSAAWLKNGSVKK